MGSSLVSCYILAFINFTTLEGTHTLISLKTQETQLSGKAYADLNSVRSCSP